MRDLCLPCHGLEHLGSAPSAGGPSHSRVSINVLHPLGHINLRGNAVSEEFLSTTADVLGEELPLTPNKVRIGRSRIFWLGPDEWRILTDADDTEVTVSKLRDSLAALPVSITDISGGQTVFRLAGPSTRDLLARGCTIDLHPNVFTVGTCAQTSLAKAQVILTLVDSSPTFDVIVRRSYSEYLLIWLQQAVGSSLERRTQV